MVEELLGCRCGSQGDAQIIGYEERIDCRIVVPFALSLRLFDCRKSGRHHAPLGDQPRGPVLVTLCPGLLLARKDQLHRALVVDLAGYAIHPTETQKLVEELDTIDELGRDRLLVPDQPDAFTAIMVG